VTKFFQAGGHYIVLVCGVAAVATLAALGHLTSTAAAFIGTATGVAVGGGVASQSSAAAQVSPPAAPPASPVGSTGPAGVGSAGSSS
jgi:hypothetical protein